MLPRLTSSGAVVRGGASSGVVGRCRVIVLECCGAGRCVEYPVRYYKHSHARFLSLTMCRVGAYLCGVAPRVALHNPKEGTMRRLAFAVVAVCGFGLPARAQINVISVDCTPFVSPGGTSFGPSNTMPWTRVPTRTWPGSRPSSW